MSPISQESTRTLTAQEREVIIDKLCADLVEGADRATLRLWDMARDGFVGFSKRTDDELLEAHQDAFDYDFIDGETDGDDEEDEDDLEAQIDRATDELARAGTPPGMPI